MPGRHAAVTPGARVAGALRDLAGLLLPVDCPGCRAPDTALCPACRAALRAGPLVVRPSVPGCPPVLAAAAYAGTVKGVVVAAKDRGRHDLAAELGAALAVPLRAALGAVTPAEVGSAAGVVLLVPAPSSRPAVRRRGGDHTQALARAAARRLGPDAPPVAPVLRLRGRVRDSAGLGAAERAENLAGHVVVRRGVRVAGRVCLPVDDVVTSGATVAEVARALRAAGALVPCAVVVAATPRTGGPSGRRGVSGASGVV